MYVLYCFCIAAVSLLQCVNVYHDVAGISDVVSKALLFLCQCLVVTVNYMQSRQSTAFCVII